MMFCILWVSVGLCLSVCLYVCMCLCLSVCLCLCHMCVACVSHVCVCVHMCVHVRERERERDTHTHKERISGYVGLGKSMTGTILPTNSHQTFYRYFSVVVRHLCMLNVFLDNMISACASFISNRSRRSLC